MCFFNEDSSKLNNQPLLITQNVIGTQFREYKRFIGRDTKFSLNGCGPGSVKMCDNRLNL